MSFFLRPAFSATLACSCSNSPHPPNTPAVSRKCDCVEELPVKAKEFLKEVNKEKDKMKNHDKQVNKIMEDQNVVGAGPLHVMTKNIFAQQK